MHAEIADLDDDLYEDGQDAILRRIYGTAPNTINVDVTVRAFVRAFRPDELIGGIAQSDSNVIISPTQIAQHRWPGGELATPQNPTPSLPRPNDKIIISGRTRSVTFVKPIYIDGDLVRINMTVSG